ncbi:MAG: gliding motility-associated C-terminal domain-containing protein [Flavobacteriia bacterium]|nr:gliding motility-associated C-terminal domain-containing protein [Flavobacteriia bacterium]
MDPSFVYAPDGAFSDFIGCPLDGPWTVTVQDNQGVDDGYIFQWTINFDAALYPDPETYQNTIVSDFWSSDPTIVSGQTDTAIVVVPIVAGPHSYTYNVTDDFGCSYDTTVIIFTLPQPTIFPDTLACFQNFNVQGTTAYAGGVWSAADTAVHFSSTTAMNPSISVSVPGTYTVTFTDNACGTSISSDIFYPGGVYTQVLDTVLCVGVSYEINAQANPNILNFSWNTGETGPSITVLSPGDYIVTSSNECYTHTDTATIGNKVCDIAVPNIMVLSSTSGNNLFFIEYAGVKSFECTILNRWGNTIYEYNNPAGSWDGKTKSGDLVDEGTYFYMIKAELESGEELTKQGFVQVYH